jgi:hypothetical protein
MGPMSEILVAEKWFSVFGGEDQVSENIRQGLLSDYITSNDNIMITRFQHVSGGAPQP